MDRQYLQTQLNEIEAALPSLLADADDPRDFWSAFADMANHLSLKTEPEDEDFVRERLSRMLHELGLATNGPVSSINESLASQATAA
jgi:hypothetical protein